MHIDAVVLRHSHKQSRPRVCWEPVAALSCPIMSYCCVGCKIERFQSCYVLAYFGFEFNELWDQILIEHIRVRAQVVIHGAIIKLWFEIWPEALMDDYYKLLKRFPFWCRVADSYTVSLWSQTSDIWHVIFWAIIITCLADYRKKRM